MWRHLAEFQSAQIRRRSGETIGHIVQDHAAIDGRRARPEAEIQVVCPAEPLNRLEILRVQPWDVYEDIVIHVDTMLILMGSAAVFGKGRELAGFH